MEISRALAFEPPVVLSVLPGGKRPAIVDTRDLEVAVLTAMAAGKPLAVVGDVLCREAARLAPDVTFLLAAYDSNGEIRPIAGPRMPPEYLAALAMAECVDGAGPQSIDLAASPAWNRFSAALSELAARACCPYLVPGRGKRLIGMLALHLDEYRQPTRQERDTAACCVKLAALAIQQDTVRAALEESNLRLDVAFGSISQGVCLFDCDKRLILANRQFAEIYDLDPAAIQPGMTLANVVALRATAGSSPLMAQETYLDWRETVQHAHGTTHSIVELANGRVIAITHQPMPDHGWVSTHEDITARRRAEAQALHMARHDPLTGLANRVLFQERVSQELQRSRRDGQSCAVLCLDLDRFKPVNDSLGHPVGDKLLKAVAERLLACVRETDTVTRLGGDEFAILLADLDRPERAGDLARRVINAIAQPFLIDETLLSIGTSVGIALGFVDGATPEELFGNADIALYRAKAEQRGTYRFFEAEMHASLQRRIHLERDLRAALQGEEFEIYYQPLVDVKRRKVCAFEALLRWRHPQKGLLAPNTFIPLAEETGLIVPIGAWALQRACQEASRWPDDITVSVNLSPAQFKSKTLVETVRGALATSGLPASRLELEVTETLLLENTAVTLGVLRELNGLGIRISMDDFGTGHSSLSYLRSFPFHKIKIDQSFVRDLVDRKDSMAIVRAILGLGRSLDMVTTAEGVETQEQLARLREEGCNEVQGYLFSKPRPAEDIPLMLLSPDL